MVIFTYFYSTSRCLIYYIIANRTILPSHNSAYKDSPFEREAYFNQNKDNYLVTRPLFAWVKYILKQRKKEKLYFDFIKLIV